MSVDIPAEIEREIEQFAQQRRLTHDQAIILLIETGLSVGKQASRTAFRAGLGMFGSPEDAALIDEVVSIAYEEQR